MNISLCDLDKLTLSEDNYSIDIKIGSGTGKMIQDILMARSMGWKKLGEAGAPTQHDIDKAVKDWAVMKLSKSDINQIQMELDI